MIKSISLIVLSIFLFLSCSTLENKKARINVVHRNIKELESSKLNKENHQIKAVRKILNNFSFNILSINELQYDTKDVPNERFKSVGRNAERFAELIGKDPFEHAISFTQANTGNKAKHVNYNYATKMTKKARKLADQDNFGLFPGQYSTAMISEFPIKSEVVLKNLKWREFNKSVSFSKFRRSNGRRIPTTIQLFDKSFTDSVIEVDGHDVHIITLHTVPSYHFGNKKTPNYERNKDQLRFLEWYLTGGTDIPVKLPKKYSDIKPLKKTDKFIAMGDWNTSIYANNKGSTVLRRIFKSVDTWIEKPIHTHESQHFGEKRTKLTLDYIAYRGLKIVDAGIYFPKENEGSCHKYSDLPSRLKSRHRKVDADKCLNEKSVELKQASDHFPIWASFEL